MKQHSAKFIFALVIFCGFVFSTFAQPVPSPRSLSPEMIKQRDAGSAFYLGRIYLQQRKPASYPLALKNFETAAKIYDELGDKANLGSALLGIGLVESLSGKKADSALTFQKALKILRSLKGEKVAEKPLNNLGFLYDVLVSKRISFKYDGLSIQPPKKGYDKDGAKLDTRFSQTSERYDVQYFNQPFTVNIDTDKYDPLDDPRFAGSSDLPKPVSFYENVLAIWKMNGVENLEVATNINLMESWAEENRNVAIFYGKQAINQYQELRQSIQQTKQYRVRRYVNQLADKFRFLADLLIANGQFAEAEEVLQMLKEEEFSDFIRRDANEIKNLKQRSTLTEKERQLIKRYTALADRVAEIGQEFLKLDEKKRLFARDSKTLTPEEQARYNQLSAQIKDANDSFKLFVDKDLSKELGATAAKQITLDRKLQEKLRQRGNGTVALYTVITEDRYRVVLTTPTIQVDGKTDIKAEELNKKIFAFRNALEDEKIEPRILGKELYDILLKPIEKELKASNAKTLVWSLDGALRYIPLAALSPDGETYLIEQYQNVLLTPKTREDLPNSNAGWRALGMGVSKPQAVFYPKYPDERILTSALPGAKTELLAIINDENNSNEKGIFKGRRFLDEDFTLANLESSLNGKVPNVKNKFNVVHFASHFRLGGDWSESFLLLGNSKILTLEDLYSSPTISFDGVELITLSACKTAIVAESNGKEFESLAGAIQAKGGQTVLATLWDVFDESTSGLMINFYRLKKENPQLTKAETLQLAQKKLILGNLQTPRVKPNGKNFNFDKERKFSHPVYWSPFVIFGNWR